MNKSTDDLIKLAKQYSDKKTTLALLSFIIILAISILSAIPEFVIRPEQILTTKFVTKLIMTLVIGITSLVCFMIIGSTTNALNPVSEIYKARELFRKSAEDIINNCYAAFKQWIIRIRRPDRQLAVHRRVLRHAGITNLHYLDLDECDLRNLISAPNKELGDAYGIRQITQAQFDVIMAIKNGKYALKFLSPDDYLIEKTVGVDQTDEEVLANQFTKRNWMFAEKVGSRTLVLVVMSITLGCIGWDVLQAMAEDMDEIQRAFTIIWDILTKLATATSSAFIGFFDGGSFNDFDATYLKIKTNVHTQFKADKDFKPLSDKELAKEEYIQYHQAQEEENRKKLGLTTKQITTNEH